MPRLDGRKILDVYKRQGNLCSVAIPGETVVLVNGQPATMADAAEQAGPAQAAAALMETCLLYTSRCV